MSSAACISDGIPAGGEGRRHGGADKAWLTFSGRPLIAHVLDQLRSLGPLEALPRDRDPASYYQLSDGYRLGVISTISKPFCASCDRLRVDARGALYTCLFSARGHDLRSTLQENGSSDALAELIRLRVWNKDVGYVASPGRVERPITMHHLGG